jgi:ElaB/YqjD/DUF883 family membrane-anchored ribosome-binding protein
METSKPAGKTTGTETANAGNKPATTTGQYGAGQAARSSFERPDDSGVGQQVSQMADRAAEAAEQAKQVVAETWDRTSQSLNQTYQQAKDYGRENPGTMTLIAFGAGIGVGLLLAGGGTSRRRTRRIVPPVMNALSEIATVFLR